MDSHNFHKRNLPENGPNNGFLRKVMAEIEANFHNEQFGVEALADRLSISRYHLHRKIKKETGRPINQFIREYRLQKAMELLQEGEMTASEVAYQVGFGSPSYFSTCFTDYYGYPPGEVRHKSNEAIPNVGFFGANHSKKPFKEVINRKEIGIGTIIFLVLLVTLLLYQYPVISTNDVGMVDTVQKRSIAVLPFENLNANQDYAYFIKGVVGAINTNLTRIKDLNVIAQSSANKYSGTSKSAKEIASELGVSHLMEVSIQRQNDKVRIEARLVNAKTQHQVWAENYDRELADIFDIQNEIAEKVALALKEHLTSEEKLAIQKKPTENTEAYELYLQGKQFLTSYSKRDILQSTGFFKRAISLDSNFARAYAGLAMSYMYRSGIFVGEMSVEKAFKLAKKPLDKALTLDPNLPIAHAYKGFYLMYGKWDFKGAQKAFRKGVEGNNIHALGLYNDFLNCMGKHKEALEIMKILSKKKPTAPPHSRMILTLFHLGKFEKARKLIHSRVEKYGKIFHSSMNGFFMLNTGNYQKAIQILERTIRLKGYIGPHLQSLLGAAYAHINQENKAYKLIEELKSMKAKSASNLYNYHIAIIYTALNQKENALKHLNQAFKIHEMSMPWLISEPQFYSLHDEPEFKEIVEKMGFPKFPS